MSERPEWFAPKRYGVGAGMPIAWQGWAVLAAFALVLGRALLEYGPDDGRRVVMMVSAIGALIVIAAMTTRGRWRWRRGDED